MTALPIEVSAATPELAPLFAKHLTLMRATSPACSVHAMEPQQLVDAGVRFFVIRTDDQPVAMGALKPLAAQHGEIKSMHVVESARGRGLAGVVLESIMQSARDAGMTRLSLETGSQAGFFAARAFYTRAGFELCPPFDAYTEDRHSIFMTRAL